MRFFMSSKAELSDYEKDRIKDNDRIWINRTKMI